MIHASKWYPVFIYSKRQSTNGKEFDTYKVGTVANSTSTMHKLMSKPITYESFEMDDFNESLSVQQMDQSGVTEAGKAVDFKAHWHIESYADYIIEHLEDIRQDYIRWIKAAEQPSDNPDWCAYCKDVAYHLWKELIRWLPESWLQTRTVTMNYENLLAICSKSQRRFHKLNEWSGRKNPLKPNFIAWARTLPYAQDFIFIDELKEESKTQEKSLRQVCSYLIDNKADHVSLKDFGIDLQYEDGTIKSAYIILQELADNINKFDKN